jgi:hypothetical protein|uniref:DOT1 domain-containing protein n=1 Tax=Phaeodactylum tricornutum TaxID=2850 RepID=A0A8J9X6P4_PHATR
MPLKAIDSSDYCIEKLARNVAVTAEDHHRLAPFNPTSEQAQLAILQILDLHHDDVLFDLGCGDARLLLAAVQMVPGLQCVGIEMDLKFTTRAWNAISSQPLSTQNRINIRFGDVLKVGYAEKDGRKSLPSSETLTLLDDSTAIYLFLVPKGLLKIQPLLDKVVQRRIEAKRSIRIVAYMFRIHSWDPISVDRTTKGDVPIYVYKF